MEKPEMPQNVPALENIETQKLEWGPDLGEMSWDVAQVKITELNARLAEGEKPWRLPSLLELTPKIKVSRDRSFQGDFYWSSTAYPSDSDNDLYFVIQSDTTYADKYKKDNPGVCVRLVRDIA